MKVIDDIGIRLCKVQGETFSLSITKTECSSAIFIRRFMNSYFASRLDNGGLVSEVFDSNVIFEELEHEFGASSYGKEKYNADVGCRGMRQPTISYTGANTTCIPPLFVL